MKKLFLLLIFAIVAMSCSRKVEIKGKITGASPMERIEVIDASSVATLPLINMPVTPGGEFSGSFEAHKNGMYVLSYGGKMTFLYLKGGQSIDITGNAMTFPEDLKINGEAKKNNDFIKDNQQFFKNYASKINVGQEIAKEEGPFLASAKKIYGDLTKHAEESAKKFGADGDAVQWEKDDISINILAYLSQYGVNHGMVTQNPAFKVSKAFTDYQATLEADGDRKVAESPNYRNYLLNKITPDFQKFAAGSPANRTLSTSELLAKFLKSKKEFSQTVKDYLIGFVGSQELKLGDYKTAEKISKVADSDISDSQIKSDLKNLTQVIGGLKEGSSLPDAALVKADGAKGNLTDLKGRPTLVMFYASWNPYIAQSVGPVIKEVTDFYKSKMNFAYVNMDDTKEQFAKTSKAMLKGLPGTNYYAEGGLNSQVAKKLGIYGFKLPGFIILDKDGKTVGKYFVNLGDPEFVTAMDKVSGLKAPTVQPQITPGIVPNETQQETPVQNTPGHK